MICVFRTWGIIGLTLTFIWQLYTLWLLVQLHESPETRMRYNRYIQLCTAAFGSSLRYFHCCLFLIASIE